MRGAGRAVLATVAALLPAASATAAAPGAPAATPLALVRFPAEIRALVPLADGALVAGVLPGERAWAARLDAALVPRWQRSFEACGRCGFLDGTRLGRERIVFVGYRDPDRSGREDGYLAVLDAASGELVAERIVLTPSGGRLWTVDASDGLLFAAGEARTNAGAGLDAWVLVLTRPDLRPLREWYVGGPLPDASADVVVAEGGAVAGGWTFSDTGGQLGGWIARFGEAREPLWRHDNADDPAGSFDVAALAPATVGGWLAVGQTSAPDPATRSLALDFRFAYIAADGTLVAFGGFDDAATDRMVVDLLRDGADRHLAVVAAQPHPDGPDALELVVIEPERAAASPHVTWRDGDRATVPDVAVRTADGTLLAGGWYRDPPAGDPARGWVARFALDVAAGER